MLLYVKVSKEGSTSWTINMDNKNAAKVIMNDSVKNCTIKSTRDEPMDLRTPTSRARFSARAVDRFTKLIQAIINTRMPMIPNMRTYWIKPSTALPFLNWESKRQSFAACKTI